MTDEAHAKPADCLILLCATNLRRQTLEPSFMRMRRPLLKLTSTYATWGGPGIGPIAKGDRPLATTACVVKDLKLKPVSASPASEVLSPACYVFVAIRRLQALHVVSSLPWSEHTCVISRH